MARVTLQPSENWINEPSSFKQRSGKAQRQVLFCTESLWEVKSHNGLFVRMAETHPWHLCSLAKIRCVSVNTKYMLVTPTLTLNTKGRFHESLSQLRSSIMKPSAPDHVTGIGDHCPFLVHCISSPPSPLPLPFFSLFPVPGFPRLLLAYLPSSSLTATQFLHVCHSPQRMALCGCPLLSPSGATFFVASLVCFQEFSDLHLSPPHGSTGITDAHATSDLHMGSGNSNSDLHSWTSSSFTHPAIS